MRVTSSLWLCRRPIGGNLYPGSYPKGFVPRVLSIYGGLKPALHLCSGPAIIKGFTNLDINRQALERGLDIAARHNIYDANLWPPLVQATMHQLPFPNETFAFTLWDPPYGRDYAQRLYKLRHLRLTRAFEEVRRVTRAGGHIGLLYQYPVQNVPTGLQTVAIYGILCGPQKHLRVFTVWQKGGL